MTIQIGIADARDRERWDAFVDGHAGASPYHLFAWKAAIERAYYLIATNNGRTAGVLPLVHLKPPWGKGSLCALPFCDVGNCLGESSAVNGELLRQAVELGRQLRVGRLEIRGETPGDAFAREETPLSVTRGKVRMILRLPATPDALWQSFKSKLRSQVLKAEKNGLTFSFDSGAVGSFYAVFCRNMRDLGSPVHSLRWIQSVIEEYGPRVKVGLVFSGNRCVAAGLILHSGRKVSIPWASTLREFNKLNPNMCLYWHLLKYAVEAGCEEFDFGRSTPGGGTFSFKAQWGAQPQELQWQRIHLSGPREEAGPAVPGSPAAELAGKCWRRLPLPLANVIGPRVRRYIDL